MKFHTFFLILILEIISPFKVDATMADFEIESCTISTVWIEPNPDKKQKYLFASQKQLNQFCNLTLGLTHKNAGHTFALYTWYDSERTTKDQIENTKLFLEEKIEDRGENPSQLPVVFRDIREIDLVQENSDIFCLKTPKYFFSDAIREVILNYLCRLERRKHYNFYMDLNIPAFSLKEFFQKKGANGTETVLTTLKTQGLLLCKADELEKTFDHENAFIVLNSQNEDMVLAHRIGIIDINLTRWRKAFKRLYLLELKKKNCKEQEKIQEIVFSSYPQMMKLFCFLKGTCNIGKPLEDINPNINKRRKFVEKNGHRIFDQKNIRINFHCYYRGPVIRHKKSGPPPKEGKVKHLDLISLAHLTVDVQKPTSHLYGIKSTIKKSTFNNSPKKKGGIVFPPF